jgi:hypothetical protein
MLLLPAFSQLERLHALAAHKLRDKGVLERVRSAANAVELYRAIRQQRRGGAPTRWRPVLLVQHSGAGGCAIKLDESSSSPWNM